MNPSFNSSCVCLQRKARGLWVGAGGGGGGHVRPLGLLLNPEEGPRWTEGVVAAAGTHFFARFWSLYLQRPVILPLAELLSWESLKWEWRNINRGKCVWLLTEVPTLRNELGGVWNLLESTTDDAAAVVYTGISPIRPGTVLLHWVKMNYTQPLTTLSHSVDVFARQLDT